MTFYGVSMEFFFLELKLNKRPTYNINEIVLLHIFVQYVTLMLGLRKKYMYVNCMKLVYISEFVFCF